MKWYLVHATKGGCGKSTVALLLAGQLCMEPKKENKVCLVDMDFRGTSLEKALTKLDENDKLEKKLKLEGINTHGSISIEYEEASSYYSEYFIKAGVDFHENMITKLSWKDGTDNKYKLDIMFCNPNQETKSKFTPNALTNDSTAVWLDYFRGRFHSMQGWLKAKGYDCVILDLPPSFDEYTLCVFERLLHMTDKDAKSDEAVARDVILYPVTTFDKAHVYQTGQYLSRILGEQNPRRKIPESIKIVLNDLHGDICRDSTSPGILTMPDITTEIKKLDPPGSLGTDINEPVVEIKELLWDSIKSVPNTPDKYKITITFQGYSEAFRYISSHYQPGVPRSLLELFYDSSAINPKPADLLDSLSEYPN